MAEAYGLKVMPTSYLIDKNGLVTARFEGFNSAHKKEAESAIEELLAKR